MPFLRARGEIGFAVQPYGPAAFLNQIAVQETPDAARAHQMLDASEVSGKLVLVN
jgi:hypothetical protein